MLPFRLQQRFFARTQLDVARQRPRMEASVCLIYFNEHVVSWTARWIPKVASLVTIPWPKDKQPPRGALISSIPHSAHRSSNSGIWCYSQSIVLGSKVCPEQTVANYTASTLKRECPGKVVLGSWTQGFMSIFKDKLFSVTKHQPWSFLCSLTNRPARCRFLTLNLFTVYPVRQPKLRMPWLITLWHKLYPKV